MRSNTIFVRGIPLLAVLLLLLAFTSTAFADDISKLREKAMNEGQVRLIVGLQLPAPFIPEGSLASPVAVEQQRQAITRARERFFAMMSSHAAGEYEQYAEWDSLPYVVLKASAAALEHLVNNPLVTTIQEDAPEDPHLASATVHIGADATWDAGFGGLDQTVVILDTGIDVDHPFYGGRVVTEACWSNAGGAGIGISLCPGGGNTQTGIGSADALTGQCWQTVGNTGTPNICYHGSHVAGVAAGNNGIAPDANIIAIQVFTRFNEDAYCGGDAPCVLTYRSDQLSALDYVNNTLRMHWNISSVNMSLGGGMNTSACDGDSRKAAIDNLLSNNIATVISAGNEDWTNALSAPGCISTAITVGNVFDGNPCGTLDEVTDNIHSVVDLLGSGRCVDSSVPDDVFDNMSGTSMAAPEVTGAFAMIRAINPSMSVADIENLLKTTGVLVSDERAPNPAGEYAGHVKPRIQLDAAVASITDQPDPPQGAPDPPQGAPDPPQGAPDNDEDVPMACYEVNFMKAADKKQGRSDDKIKIKSSLKLVQWAEPFEPETDVVRVTIDDQVITIPAGSFEAEHSSGLIQYSFKGDIPDVGHVHMRLNFDECHWSIDIRGKDAADIVQNDGASVGLTIGTNVGEDSFEWTRKTKRGAMFNEAPPLLCCSDSP